MRFFRLSTLLVLTLTRLALFPPLCEPPPDFLFFALGFATAITGAGGWVGVGGATTGAATVALRAEG